MEIFFALERLTDEFGANNLAITLNQAALRLAGKNGLGNPRHCQRVNKAGDERERHQDRAARVKAVLHAAGLPVMPSTTHIVPLFVGDPEKCKQASDMLLGDHGIYIQPINYPTVPRGSERLRITPSPYHEDALIDALAEALVDVWQRLELPFGNRASAMAAE